MGDVPTNAILLCQFHLIYSVKNQRLKSEVPTLLIPLQHMGFYVIF